MVDLDEALSELHRVPPSQFVAARSELAKRAVAEGEQSVAGEIKKLRRPARSAWAVNVVALERPAEIQPLLELGEELRKAQRSLSGDRLRALSAKRRELVSELKRAIFRNADALGQRLNAQGEVEVEQTLEAALADPSAAYLVASGRLTSALNHIGFTEDAPLATKRAGAAGKGRGRSKADAQSAKRAAAAVEALRSAEADLEQARGIVEGAQAALSQARRAVAEAEARVRTKRAEMRKATK